MSNIFSNTMKIIAFSFANGQYLGEYGDNSQISFDYNGQTITNPWIDPSGRFGLSTEQAYETYGKENVDKFIKDAFAYIDGFYDEV